jgi:DNA-binding MltR family transcriptional regulator
LLHEILSGYLISDESKVKTLFEGTMPLATFSAKIELTYCLGLISSDEYNNIKIVKSIRNDFAHRLSNLSFGIPPTQDRCSSLKLPSELIYDGISPRDKFRRAINYLCFNLLVRTSQAEEKKCSEPKDISNLFVEFGRLLSDANKSSDIQDSGFRYSKINQEE